MRHCHRKSMKKAITAIALWTFYVPLAHAAGNFGLDTAAGSTIPKTTDLAQLIGKILQAALGFVGTLFLLLMVYAGFVYMTARGDEKKVSEAKKMIVGAVVGVVIIASAYAITSFVLSAATGAGGSSQSSNPTPISSPDEGGCQPRQCGTSSDCSVVGSLCYTGTCTCADGSHPTSDAPCSIDNRGQCDLAPQSSP